MQIIRLKVDEKIFQNLMWFLHRFSPEELQIIEEDNSFISIQNELKEKLNVVENNKAEFIDLEQLDDDLETTIRKHEA